MSTKSSTKQARKPREAAKATKVRRQAGKPSPPPKPTKKPRSIKPSRPKAPPAPGAFPRPQREGPCSQLWAMFDRMQAREGTGEFLSIGEAKVAAERQGLELGTCTVQFYKWRRTMGVRGRGSKQKVN